ncbi:MAG: hypothetical protein V1817_00745 [Candidatus Micrarchaeota archaeon]
MEAIELFAVVVGFFLLGLAAYALALYWFSRKTRRKFGDANSRLGEISFYLNEFRKSMAKLSAKAAEKVTATLVEKKLADAAHELEEEKELQKLQKQRERVAAVSATGKRKQGREREDKD